VINVDDNPSYPKVVAELKRELIRIWSTILSVQAFTHSLIPLLTMLGTSGILLLTNRREGILGSSVGAGDGMLAGVY
jgi:hypothetical protein